MAAQGDWAQKIPFFFSGEPSVPKAIPNTLGAVPEQPLPHWHHCIFCCSAKNASWPFSLSDTDTVSLEKIKIRVVSPSTNILQPPIHLSPFGSIGNMEYINFGAPHNEMLHVTTEMLGKHSPGSVPGQADLST